MEMFKINQIELEKIVSESVEKVLNESKTEIIKETIIKNLNNIIEESGIGVADEVDAVTEQIFDFILKSDNAQINLPCFGTTIKLFIYKTNFKTKEEYEDSLDGAPTASWIEPFK